MFYDCWLGTITFKRVLTVPPMRKVEDALSSCHLSYVLRNPIVHYIARGRHLVLENLIYYKWKDASSRGSMKRIDGWLVNGVVLLGK